MKRWMCKAKIHNARVVETNVHYQGSIAIAKELLDASGILKYEIVQVININTGARFETYVIEGEKGSGAALKGGAARLGEPGDRLIVLSYALVDEKELSGFKPRMVSLDENNSIINAG